MAGHQGVGHLAQFTHCGCLLLLWFAEGTQAVQAELARHRRIAGDNDRHPAAVESQATVPGGVLCGA